MDYLDDDFYPEDLDLPSSGDSSSRKDNKSPIARKRLIPPSHEIHSQRLFYLYILVTFFFCLILFAYVLYNRAEKQRLISEIVFIDDSLETLREIPSSSPGDNRLQSQMQALFDRKDGTHKELSAKSKFPMLVYFPIIVVMLYLLISAFKLIQKTGKELFAIFRSSICLFSATITVIVFNLTFILYFFNGRLWPFSFAFVFMLISIILIISPNLYLIFAGNRFRDKSARVETLDELQDRLPFDDVD